MMRVFHRAGQALLAVALALSLLAAPVAWGATPGSEGSSSWLDQLWTLVLTWVAPAQSGPAADPHGLQTTSDANSTTEEPWVTPEPLDPITTDTTGDDGDRGPAADPDG